MGTCRRLESLVVAGLAAAGPGLFAAAQPAAARAFARSSVSVESAAPAKVQGADAEPQELGEDRRRQRIEGRLVAPIPASLLWGMFVANAHAAEERRERVAEPAPAGDPFAVDEGPAGGLEGDPLTRLGVSAAGATYLPHAKEGAPRFFAAVERYGTLRGPQQRPMVESTLGVDLSDEDMPVRLKFRPTDDAESHVELAYRQFPGFARWRPQVGHRIVAARGLGVDLKTNDRALLTWQTPDEGLKFWAGVRWADRAYPFTTEAGATGWLEGTATTRLAGARIEVRRPLFVALEAGVQKEDVQLTDEAGERLSGYETRFAPWARVALETWVVTP
jgi:hypothetical protein